MAHGHMRHDMGTCPPRHVVVDDATFAPRFARGRRSSTCHPAGRSALPPSVRGLSRAAAGRRPGPARFRAPGAGAGSLTARSAVRTSVSIVLHHAIAMCTMPIHIWCTLHCRGACALPGEELASHRTRHSRRDPLFLSRHSQYRVCSMVHAACTPPAPGGRFNQRAVPLGRHQDASPPRHLHL
eukprot:5350247-Prymnesium_polylepis.1